MPMEIVANHCGSNLSDTYMHLLDAPALGESARLIVSNDNCSGEGCCPNTGHARIKQRLPAGSYYIVSEGFNSNGNITTTITGRVVPVTGVSLNTANLSLLTGATSQLTVTFAPADATSRAVSWTSSNTAVATVSDAGLVTARTAGTTTITVTTADGARTATCTVTVTVPVYAYSVNGNGGTVSGGTQAGNYPAGTTITLPASATRTNYTCAGFTSAAWSGTKSLGSTFSMPGSNTAVTANWTPATYTVTLNWNGGSGSALTSYVYGTGAALPANGTKTGHVFAGWTAG